MELITKLFDMDFTALVPELSGFLRTIHMLLILAVLAGPVIMLVLGYLYLFRPAPEANYHFGFRCYYGMGSIEAWRFSQKMAGLCFGVLGAALLIVMLIVVLCFIGKDLLRIARTCVICLLWQAGLTLIARLVPTILSAVYFDGKGNRRR